MLRNVFKIDIFSPSSHLLLNQCLSGIDLFTANRLAKSPSNTPDTRMFTIRKGTAIGLGCENKEKNISQILNINILTKILAEDNHPPAHNNP